MVVFSCFFLLEKVLVQVRFYIFHFILSHSYFIFLLSVFAGGCAYASLFFFIGVGGSILFFFFCWSRCRKGMQYGVMVLMQA